MYTRWCYNVVIPSQSPYSQQCNCVQLISISQKTLLGGGDGGFWGGTSRFCHSSEARGCPDFTILPWGGGGGGNVHIMSNTNCQINESSSNTTIEHI